MGRLRGFLWLTAGLVVAVLAGVVAWMTLSQAAAPPETTGEPAMAPPRVEVVVAAQPIAVRSLLTPEDVELLEMPVDAVPETAVRAVDEAVGRLTMVELYPGEILLSERLVAPDVVAADGRTALLINDDQVLMAFPAEDLMSRVNVLKPGDHVDLLFSFNFPAAQVDAISPGAGAVTGPAPDQEEEEEQVTFTLLQNVVIAGITGGGEDGGVRALLFTLSPQDALVLKYMKDAGGVVDVVLRAPGVEAAFPVDPVEMEYLINRYLLSTGEE